MKNRSGILGVAMVLAVGAALAGASRAQEDPGAAAPSVATSTGDRPAPGRGRGGAVSAPTVEGPSAAFAATVYQIRMPADQIGRLDGEALTAAAATPDFGKALAALGTVHPLYLVNQSVRLADDSIRIGSSTPYVTNSQVNNTGGVINSVAYQSVGALFSLRGKPKAAVGMELDLSVEVSTIDEASGVPIATNVKAPFFRLAQMAFKGLVQPGKPFVMISADGASPGDDGKANVFVAKVTLGAPQENGSGAAAAPALPAAPQPKGLQFSDVTTEHRQAIAEAMRSGAGATDFTIEAALPIYTSTEGEGWAPFLAGGTLDAASKPDGRSDYLVRSKGSDMTLKATVVENAETGPRASGIGRPANPDQNAMENLRQLLERIAVLEQVKNGSYEVRQLIYPGSPFPKALWLKSAPGGTDLIYRPLQPSFPDHVVLLTLDEFRAKARDEYQKLEEARKRVTPGGTPGGRGG